MIAHGTNSDLVVGTNGQGTSSLTISYSSFATVRNQGGTLDTSEGHNQSQPPALADPATGDFHGLAGSPTVDAGVATFLDGPTDPDGVPRALGAAPDIGAYELPAPGASTGPAQTAGSGATLTFLPGSWSGQPAFSFGWLCDGSPIARAHSAAYRTRAADGRHAIQCQLTATNAAGALVVDSAARLIAAHERCQTCPPLPRTHGPSRAGAYRWRRSNRAGTRRQPSLTLGQALALRRVPRRSFSSPRTLRGLHRNRCRRSPQTGDVSTDDAP